MSHHAYDSIEALADRPAGQVDSSARPFRHLVPLVEILAELLQVGPTSQRVQRPYRRLLSELGPELWLLQHAPLDDLARLGPPLLDEALARLRRGEVLRQPGFDGREGRIRLFEERELGRSVPPAR